MGQSFNISSTDESEKMEEVFKVEFLFVASFKARQLGAIGIKEEIKGFKVWGENKDHANLNLYDFFESIEGLVIDQVVDILE